MCPKTYSLLLISALLLAPGISCKSKSGEYDARLHQSTSVEEADVTHTTRPAHWGYEGEDGPSHWANLSPAYALCAEGKFQSPVNISKKDVSSGTHWEIRYDSTSLRIAHTEQMEDIVDNGHTIQVSVDEGSELTYSGKVYELKQFHFHTPSEHTLDGKHLPMEMHLVHQSTDGQFAVIGVLFKEGMEANPGLAKIIAHMPDEKGESVHVTDEHLHLSLHLPADNFAYHYMGSLTTPPCTENVQWLILHEMVTVTKDQIEAFAGKIGPNNRPVQPLNKRVVNNDDLLLKDNH